MPRVCKIETITSMFIYNVTTKVEHPVSTEWLQWLQQVHIPAMIATGCFTKAVILKLKAVDDSDGLTYAVQYYANNETDYEKYLANFATDLRAEALNKWGDKIISFRTIMEVVN